MVELFVHHRVLEHFTSVPARPYEVGGWLLGYRSEDEASVFITHATPPASIGTPLGVRISGRGHRRRFDEAWDVSDGLVTYLGDWHTHPGCPPLPSKQDARALTQLGTKPNYGTSRPLMGIVSTPRWGRDGAPRALAFYMREPNASIVGMPIVITKTLPNEAERVPSWRWPCRRTGEGLVRSLRTRAHI